MKHKTSETIDKKKYIAELVSRAAQKAGAEEDAGKEEIQEKAPGNDEESELSQKKRKAWLKNEETLEEQAKTSWYFREITVLRVKLPLWLIVGAGVIVLALLFIAFWIGSLIARPKFALAYSEIDSESVLSGEAQPVPYQYFVSSSPVNSQTEYTAARSMIVWNRTNNSPILSENPDRVLPIASLTKIMTAYVVVNTWQEHDVFTISVAVDPDEESSAGLEVGQTYSRDDLLSALLIESAAEAGYTFADSFEGGRTAFVERMNATAIELGMASTEFVDPVGIGELNVSTATDMAVLTRFFLADEKLANIVGTNNLEICSQAGKCATLETTNKLLIDAKNFYGVKTGYTVKAGPCLVAWYKKGSSDYIIVLLYVEGRGTDPRFDIAKELSSIANSATM